MKPLVTHQDSLDEILKSVGNPKMVEEKTNRINIISDDYGHHKNG